MARDAAWEELGQQLVYLREAAGVTLTETARLLETSKGHLSSVEHGRDRPSPTIVEFYEEHFHGDGQASGLYIAAVTATRPRQRRPLADRPPYPIPGVASTFVSDVTVPDGMIMPPYFWFEKIWRIRNSGTVPWTGRWLARRGALAGHGIPHSKPRVQIPDTEPGQEVNISAWVMSQPLAGSSQANWKMVDDDGWRYFPDRYPLGLVLSIRVEDNAPVPDLRRSA
jgi:Ig-like domain from next to BRCA1 gene/Helix-turn-helix domain